VWAGDSYLKRPCDGWSVVYGLHSITSHVAQIPVPPSLNHCQQHCLYSFIFITCGGSAFSVDALIDRPSKLSRSGFTY